MCECYFSVFALLVHALISCILLC